MIGRKLAASIAAAIFAGLMLFQILLALGYPLGEAAWGGYYTELPAGMRIASALSAAFYAGIISITLCQRPHAASAVWPSLHPFEPLDAYRAIPSWHTNEFGLSKLLGASHNDAAGVHAEHLLL